MLAISLFILAVSLIFIPRLWRYHIKPHFVKSAMHELLKTDPQGRQFKKTAEVLGALYRGVHSERTGHASAPAGQTPGSYRALR